MTLTDVCLGYGKGPDVLTVTDEQVVSGELVCLVGPNGGGKTTLLKCMAGLLRPRTGTIRLDNRPLYGPGAIPREERARRLAVVLTDRIAPAYLHVRDLVMLGRIPRGGTSREHARAVDQALDATGVSDLADRPLGRLSDGERQRVMISRALAQEPAVLLLDEPTAHLDPPHQTELFLLLQDLIGTGRIESSLVATHHLHLALHFSSRLFLVSRRLTASGSPRALLTAGAIASVFPETPGIHLDPLKGWFTPVPKPVPQ